MATKLILPLMMYGKVGNYWHEQGKPIRKKVKVGEEPYKTGARVGQMRPIYEWVVATKKKKVLVGFEGVYKSGKNKGEPKPVYKTKDMPIDSTGIFPSENRIHVSLRGGARRLHPAAEARLDGWAALTRHWAEANNWVRGEVGAKVVANMTFFLPDDKIRDTHNAKKLLLDSFEGIIHENDMWILDRTEDFHFDELFPRIEIEFEYKGR